MAAIINVVEPTLNSQAGHCYSFVSALCKASDEAGVLRLWVGRHAELAFPEKNIQVRRYFFRRIRRLQGYWLYKQLLATPGKIFVSTAGRTDLMLLDWAAQGVIPPEKAYLYFHWSNTNDKKFAGLQQMACKQPNLAIFGPTASVVNIFQDAGFGNARVIPYPISQPAVEQQAASKGFSHLLYAGAARQDKGFTQVVDLVAYLRGQGIEAPITMQISGEHYGKYDAATRADIRRLQAIAYPQLQLLPETLDPEEYVKLFAGAICLQLYQPSDFADRISGVTLDAFSAGSPVVATAGTWIARMTQRFDAGVAVEDTAPPRIWSAVQQVMAEYARYNRNACAAGSTLQEENSAQILYQALAD